MYTLSHLINSYIFNNTLHHSPQTTKHLYRLHGLHPIDILELHTLRGRDFVCGKERKLKGHRRRLATYCRNRLIDPCGVPHTPFVVLLERAAKCLLVPPGLLHVLVNRLDAQVLTHIHTYIHTHTHIHTINT